MIARTIYFDRLFCDALNRSIPQLVLLGAGYDTRAYRFEKDDRNTVVFELDTVQTQNRKIERLNAVRIPVPASVRFDPIDFNEESLADALHKAGYDPQEKTLFLWEGAVVIWIRKRWMKRSSSPARQLIQTALLPLTTPSR